MLDKSIGITANLDLDRTRSIYPRLRSKYQGCKENEDLTESGMLLPEPLRYGNREGRKSS